ncbi:MAG: hypothetical protein JST19_10775 [Bacteroidetes bacterium]|nr:hypothetical protein [Bacteroidota bacterium]
MSEIKTLADQLRQKMAKPDTPEKNLSGKKKAGNPPAIPEIIDLIRAYDITGHKTLVHARFEGQMAQTLQHLKMATGIEVTRLICFAVKRLFEQHPELREVIKQHLEKFQL